MPPEKFLAVFWSLTIFIHAFIIRLHTKTWINPFCIYCLFWGLYTFIPLIAIPGLLANPLAIAYISLSCLFFSISAFCFEWKDFTKIQIISKLPFSPTPFLKFIFLVFAGLSLVGTIINWNIQGVSFLDIASDPLDTSAQYLAKRYDQSINANFFSRISIAFAYPATIIGGILFTHTSNGYRRILYVGLSLLPALLMMLVEAAKGTIFLALILFWSGTLLKKLSTGQRDLFSFSLSTFLPLIFIITAATIFAFLARGIDTNESLSAILDYLYFSIISYSSGHIYAFSDWFSYYISDNAIFAYGDLENSRGYYTFKAIFDVVGAARPLPHGIYHEYFHIPNLLQTNIYTHFRGLILDFGLFGSLIFSALAGLFVTVSFLLLLYGRCLSAGATLFVHFIGYSYTSFIISVLIWNSIFVSAALIYIIFSINSRILSNNLSKRTV